MNRMEDFREMCCSVEKWCAFVHRMSPAQHAKIQETDLQSMLDIPPIKMRCTLIRFMVEKYEPKTNKFVVKKIMVGSLHEEWTWNAC
jgi:hypothetical protein